MLDSLFSGAGKSAVNAVVNVMGGKEKVFSSLKNIVLENEPAMVQSMLKMKTTEYKDYLQKNKYNGVDYNFTPYPLKNPDTQEVEHIICVFLVPYRLIENTETGVFKEIGKPLKVYTLEEFFNILLSGFITKTAEEKASTNGD